MLSGLVLAGGRSRRMGQDKALMPYHGHSLMEHAASLLKQAGCRQVLISRNQPGYLNDILPDNGPLGGVHAALNALNTGDELLVVPVDMPKLSVIFLQSLVNSGREQNQAVTVRHRHLPFYLPVTTHTHTMLHQLLTERQERKVVRFLDALNALEFTGHTDDSIWLNVNTPDDWPDEF
ncbi:molybdenum cofactor guanylyltransferase [Salinimonas lutimaris]|uniref:molybdenum cofactor guanylyltransferase n=1 Tax=Salinimonas lutimaris TaxID=914153 RepID=UPI0010C0FF3A|nr:molybdenum cofactor guanylyltransferase [Salinimonas lutimaris]